MPDYLEKINKVTEEISVDISKYIIKHMFNDSYNDFKPHKIADLGRYGIAGLTKIACDLYGCKAIEKYIDRNILKASLYPAIRTKIHEHMHDYLANKCPELILNKELHEAYAEIIPYRWFRKNDPAFAEFWKKTSPYKDLLEGMDKMEGKEFRKYLPMYKSWS